VATAARKRAIAGNWCAAAALDDDQLDTPGYLPARAGNPPPAPASPPRSARVPPSSEDPPMTSEHRITSGLITDVLDALERHGYVRSYDLHAGRAIGLIGDLACIYGGTQDHPATAHPIAVPPSTCPESSRHDAITLTRADASTVFAELDIAADDKRYRAEMRPDCPDQSCPTCQTHLHDAQAFDQMADRMLQAAQSAPVAGASQPGPARRSQPVADREADQ
jgi:hypothetical protein